MDVELDNNCQVFQILLLGYRGSIGRSLWHTNLPHGLRRPSCHLHLSRLKSSRISNIRHKLHPVLALAKITRFRKNWVRNLVRRYLLMSCQIRIWWNLLYVPHWVRDYSLLLAKGTRSSWATALSNPYVIFLSVLLHFIGHHFIMITLNNIFLITIPNIIYSLFYICSTIYVFC